MSDSGRARDWGTTEPCPFCGHIHPYYVVCEVCECDRHRPPLGFDLWQAPCREPTEILTGFIFLGDYNNNAFRMDLRYTLGINRALNITTLCGPTFHSEIVKCVGLIQKCERKRESVVVYCINGINRAAAVVIGYLMKFRHWSLEKSYEYVRGLRPSVDMSDLVVHEGLVWYEQAVITKKYKLPPGAARASRNPKNQSFLSRTFSLERSSYIDWSPSSVSLFEPVTGVGQATEISANQANPNIAGSSRIDAPKHNYLRTRAPTYSCGNAEGFLTPTFSTGTDTSIFDSSPSSVPPNELITGAGQATEISANQANPNIASSSRTAASNYKFQDATAPTYGFGNVVGVPTPTFSTGTGNSIFDSSPSSVPPNELITGAGQATEVSFMANQASPNIAGSSRIAASNYNLQHTTAPTYSFGNAVGVPTPTFSTGTSNSIFDSSPSSVPPNELITGAGQATEVSFMDNEANPDDEPSFMDNEANPDDDDTFLLDFSFQSCSLLFGFVSKLGSCNGGSVGR